MNPIQGLMRTLDPRKGAPGKWGIFEAVTAWLIIGSTLAVVLLEKHEGFIKILIQLGPMFAGGAFMGYRMAKNEDPSVAPKKLRRK